MRRSHGAWTAASRCARASAASRPIPIRRVASSSRFTSSRIEDMGHAEQNAALSARVTAHFAESANLKLAASQSLAQPVARASALLADCLRSGGKALACGNGGSAADAQHFAAELVNRFETERPPLAAVALTTDSSNLTSIANDYAWEQVFSKQLRALGRRGDVLLAISTSGNSRNVLEALPVAHELGVRVIALTGNGGGTTSFTLNPVSNLPASPPKRPSVVQLSHCLVLLSLFTALDLPLIESA